MAEGSLPYRHTQVGWVILGAFGAVLLALLPVWRKIPGGPAWIALLLATTLLFASLTVSVDDAAVEVRFGPGLVRKRLRLAEIESCRAVRNAWWWGWGIRFWCDAEGCGWLYNVSGLEAVELRLRNGQRIRIGTDEPEALCQAIRERLSPA